MSCVEEAKAIIQNRKSDHLKNAEPCTEKATDASPKALAEGTAASMPDEHRARLRHLALIETSPEGDAITALGVWDISPERDGIDVLVTGSQKALMLPPGLGFVSLSDRRFRLGVPTRVHRPIAAIPAAQ